MKSRKREIKIATITGAEAEALRNDRAELSGKYRKGCYELYLTIKETV